MLYGVPPACVYFSINLNCSDKSMKITNCSITIEVSKDENGYSNNYYVDINEQGVSVSFPYIKQRHEQVTLVNDLINQFIDDFNHLSRRIDGFNRDMQLEQYAPKAVKTEETTSEVSPESASGQPERGGSEGIDNCPSSTEETVIATVRGSSNEGLTVIGEE